MTMDPFSLLSQRALLQGQRFLLTDIVYDFSIRTYYWPNSNIKYLAINYKINALDSRIDWEITKYKEDGSKKWGVLRGSVAVESSINTLFLGYT